MAEFDNGVEFEKYIFVCGECKSKMIFEMTFPFEKDIDVYCPCSNIMKYVGAS